MAKLAREINAIEKREQKRNAWPTFLVKRRYHTARVRLGLSPNAVGSINWKRLNKRTTFIWKFDTLEETARWVIARTFEDFAKHPTVDRAQIALHFIYHGFGIMASDILAEQRSKVLVVPRMIAMICVKRSGIGRNDVARRFNRDHTCVPQAEKNVGHFFEGLPSHEQDPLPLGPASDGQPPGSIST